MRLAEREMLVSFLALECSLNGFVVLGDHYISGSICLCSNKEYWLTKMSDS